MAAGTREALPGQRPDQTEHGLLAHIAMAEARRSVN